MVAPMMLDSRPARFEAVTIRPLGREDAPGLQRLYARMSPQSRYWRFLTLAPSLPAERAARLADVDQWHHVAFAAEVDGELIGVARYVRSACDPATAEIAAEVEDAWHREGVARALIAPLVRHARSNGVEVFTATVARQNRPCFALIRSVWPGADAVFDGSTADFTMRLDDVSPRYSAA